MASIEVRLRRTGPLLRHFETGRTRRFRRTVRVFFTGQRDGPIRSDDTIIMPRRSGRFEIDVPRPLDDGDQFRLHIETVSQSDDVVTFGPFAVRSGRVTFVTGDRATLRHAEANIVDDFADAHQTFIADTAASARPDSAALSRIAERNAPLLYDEAVYRDRFGAIAEQIHTFDNERWGNLNNENFDDKWAGSELTSLGFSGQGIRCEVELTTQSGSRYGTYHAHIDANIGGWYFRSSSFDRPGLARARKQRLELVAESVIARSQNMMAGDRATARANHSAFFEELLATDFAQPLRYTSHQSSSTSQLANSIASTDAALNANGTRITTRRPVYRHALVREVPTGLTQVPLGQRPFRP